MKKIQLRKSVKDFSKLFLSNMAMRVISIIGIAIYARYTNKTELAVLPLYEIIGGMSMMIFNLGIPPYLVKTFSSFLKESKVKASDLVRTCYHIVVPGILFFSFLTFIFSDFIAGTFFNYPDYSGFIKIFSFGFVFTGIHNLNSYLFWASGRFGKESIISVVTQLSRTSLGLSLFFVMGIKGLVIGLVASSVIIAVFSSYFVRDLLFTGKFNKGILKEMLKDSYPFYFEGYLMYFRRQGDQLVISTFLGPELLAVYFIAKKIYAVIASILQMLEKVITQSLSKVKDNIEDFSIKVSEVIHLSAAILFPGIFLIIALTPFLIPVIVGNGYKSSIVPSMILTFGLLIDFMWRTTFGRAVFFLEKSWSRFKITFVDSVFLIFFLLVLSKFFALTGVAVSRVLANFSAGIYTYLKIKRTLKLQVNYYFILVVFISSIVMCMVIIFSYIFFKDNILYLIIFTWSGLLFFIITIGLLVSKEYYNIINTISPITIKDPFKIFSTKVLKSN
jgi:O-antigen/teichoic acid export membrane protein